MVGAPVPSLPCLKSGPDAGDGVHYKYWVILRLYGSVANVCTVAHQEGYVAVYDLLRFGIAGDKF